MMQLYLGFLWTSGEHTMRYCVCERSRPKVVALIMIGEVIGIDALLGLGIAATSKGPYRFVDWINSIGNGKA